MANEALKRIPTSTGNRKVLTWSGWIKRNKVETLQYIFNRAFVSSANAELYFTTSNSIEVTDYAGGYTIRLITSQKFRDTSSWYHILLSINTTSPTASDRVKLYVNGSRITDFSTETYPTINLETQWNTTKEHEFSDSGGAYDILAELTDVFFVDGQALTPDVFGFYKDGDGYMSSGTTQATDFRPGQWSPHSPRKIKSDIERRGGFGVNGFYLPMNDSSNPGADFHCTPNSIIKLKGEDLPQPRNGAPTTSDDYVSQLRDDPFADNIVLAIPFITGGRDSGAGDYSADIKGSGTNKTVTVNGGFSVGDCPSYYGSALKGSSGNRHVAVSAHSDFANLYDVDHTIEFWYKNDAWNGGYLPHNDIISNRHSTNNVAWRISFTDKNNAEDGIQIYGSNGFSSGANILNNDWNHCAVEQQNGATTLYINGVTVARNGNEHGYQTYKASTGPIIIGSDGRSANLGDTYSFNGQIQDVRIYKGVAKYKGGFDVPKPYTPVGIEAFRTTTDTCKNNFATLNPLIGAGIASGDNAAVLRDGNLYYDNANQSWTISSIGVSSGKYYAEFMVTGGTLGSNIGVCGDNRHGKNNQNYHAARGISYIRLASTSVTKDYNATSITETANDAPLSYASGSIVGITIDFDNKEIKYYKNGTLIRTDSTPASYTPVDFAFYFLAFRTNDGASPAGSNWADVIANFGQNPSFSGTVTAGTNADGNGKGLFKYAPPSGFLALCEDNLPTPAIADPGDYFKTVLYEGDNSVGRRINVGFQPDLVWVKARNASPSHILTDSVRGIGHQLSSDDNGVEVDSGTFYLTGFANNGFDLGDGANSGGNTTGRNYVAWCWKAGGAAVTNSDGSITSQVSANQTAGFSIVSYTGNNTAGATIGHGLGKKPSFMIVKERTGASGWFVYHKNPGATKFLSLHDTTAAGTETGNTACWYATEPNTSVFTVGQNGATNENNRPIIAYCWTEIEGYSKFGSYAGNQNADGIFIYCGFKPAWVLIKSTTLNPSAWILVDSSRDPHNPCTQKLFPDYNGAENVSSPAGAVANTNHIDLLSNGFKLRSNNSWTNYNSNTYIFAAFAESPFQTANAK